MAGLGNAAVLKPDIVDLSIINEAAQYYGLFQSFKEEAFNTVGITRQRMGQQKAYETATGIEGAVNYSEAQTEIYFNQYLLNPILRILHHF